MIKKTKFNISKTNKFWLALLIFSIIAVWACQKERPMETMDSSEQISTLSKWYEKQIIPTENEKAFSKMNHPKWQDTKIKQEGDTIFYTTLVLSKEKITRELQTTYHDGVYNAVIREYNFGIRAPFISVTTLTINGRLLEKGYFDDKKQYILSSIAENYNLVLMGGESMGGGLPPIDVPPPTNPTNPPTPTFPPGTGGDAGGVNPTPSIKLPRVNLGNDCEGKDAVNTRLNISPISMQNRETLSKMRTTPVNGKHVEHGFETVLKDLNSLEFENKPIRSGAESNINLQTLWNSNYGFTVGYTHSHPLNGAPSPSDLFSGLSFYNTGAIPEGQKSIFTNYYTSTIITDNFVYVVTIKNSTKWGNGPDFANPQTRATENGKYQDKALEYILNTQQYNDTINAQLYALLNMYGDTVNIYRAPNTPGQLNFFPLELALGGVVSKRCN